MAQYNIRDPEYLLVCPYDSTHMVRQKRFQYHLLKCRKNYIGKDYATCPFNACHEFPRPELRYHVANCTDKAIVEKDLIYDLTQNKGDGTYFKGKTDVPPPSNCTPASEECWDQDISPYVVQKVDPSVFLGQRCTFDFESLTKQERNALIAKVKSKGIILGDKASTEDENENLRLPHQQARVLSNFNKPVPDQSGGSASKPKLQTINAGLGCGRGIKVLWQQDEGGVPGMLQQMCSLPGLGRGRAKLFLNNHDKSDT